MLLLVLPLAATSCRPVGADLNRVPGQTDFLSAAPNGAAPAGQGGDAPMASSEDARGASGDGTPSAAPAELGANGDGSPRAVEETDLYRLDGDRLYYLNQFRGLMIFDVTNPDDPKLLGRSPIYGSPVQMVVHDGIASVVVADWFGRLDDGTPFHGSIVRGIDARDPANIKIVGEAKLGGWVRDTRVVGDVLYAVSEDYSWSYGWYDEGGGEVAVSSPAGGFGGSKVIVSSVNIKDGKATQKSQETFDGYSAIFYVTQNAIMFARDASPYTDGKPKTELTYVDITDPAGAITLRGRIEVRGRVQGWGPDNGRFNVDFSDGVHARVIACGESWCGGSQGSYVISTVDFSNPNLPVANPTLEIPSTGWSVAARFDGTRLFVSPSDGYWTGQQVGTPIRIYDLSDPVAPVFAGETTVEGQVWMFMPNGDHVFALGNDFDGVDYGSAVALHYLDVSNLATPHVVGTSTFGSGWAWTPAAGTFKAFTLNNTEHVVVLPFSGWDHQTYAYNNGLQLIEFTPTSLTTKPAAKVKGWVERGIFVKNRVVALSNQALSVVDYTNHDAPVVTKELVLARNVIDARPRGDEIAQLSTEWWGNDVNRSTMRVLPIANAEENHSLDGTLAELDLEGTNARAYHHGDFSYVVTDVRREVACAEQSGGGGPGVSGDVAVGKTGQTGCFSWTQRITVVDLTAGAARVRGSVELPAQSGYGWWWGYWGCYWYDWYHGADVVQVQGDALAFRRWLPSTGKDYDVARHGLFIADLRDPDQPSLSTMAVTNDTTSWWGNLMAIGDQLYVTDYAWHSYELFNETARHWYVRYYLNRIDLSDRANPKVGARINIPGILVGGSDTDQNLLYTIDYRWYDDYTHDELSVIRLEGQHARLLGSAAIDGYVGKIHVRGDTAYFSAQEYWKQNNYRPTVRLHALDLTDPARPVDRVAEAKKGWGWLLAVEGDRAFVTSGWGSEGIDLYKLAEDATPTFDGFVRTRGWWPSALARQGNDVYVSTGYWGVQHIVLEP